MKLAALFLLALTFSVATAQSMLDKLEADFKTVSELRDPFAGAAQWAKYRTDLIAFIETDALKSGEEFRRAAAIVPFMNARFFEHRMRHELTFVAMALGDREAAKRLKASWDQFLRATGRLQRFETVRQLPGTDDDSYRNAQTVACVRNVLLDPDKAREDVKRLQPNKELADLVAEDQKVRQSDWSKLTSAQLREIYLGDIRRRKQLKGLLSKVRLLTAKDYAAASLVMQHGSWFEDYALAHELALCATILDPAVGRQLVALTYDRMLESAGYHQRVGTQYHGATLADVDSQAFSDEMRKALGRKPLADVAKTIGG